MMAKLLQKGALLLQLSAGKVIHARVRRLCPFTYTIKVVCMVSVCEGAYCSPYVLHFYIPDVYAYICVSCSTVAPIKISLVIPFLIEQSTKKNVALKLPYIISHSF